MTRRPHWRRHPTVDAAADRGAPQHPPNFVLTNEIDYFRLVVVKAFEQRFVNQMIGPRAGLLLTPSPWRDARPASSKMLDLDRLVTRSMAPGAAKYRCSPQGDQVSDPRSHCCYARRVAFMFELTTALPNTPLFVGSAAYLTAGSDR